MLHRLLLLLSLNLLAAPAFASDTATTPPPLADGWKVVAAADRGWNLAHLNAMETALANGAAPATTSVLVARDGELVYERYFNDGERERLNDVRSATKTITALLVGAAIERQLIGSDQDRVYDYFSDRQWLNPDPRKRDFRLQDLLTMSSQWECNDDNEFSSGNEERMYVAADWTQFVLDLPMKGYAPWMTRPADSPYGRAFAYCTVNSFMLGAIVERASRQSLAAFSAAVLEQPLGISKVHWGVSAEGVGMGGGGTRYRSRDLAKFGQLLLDQGRWQGKQIINAAWVKQMMTVHAQARDDADYGYQMWHFRFPAHDQLREVWAMSGNGGNYVFVVPAERLVVVITRTGYNSRDMHPQSQRLLTDYVLKALPSR